ncbi:unnamed protein product [Symbiodinium sp. CCMP2592]|nr:unnamed protein product [Symbiodinium sp. CCMP2592]
MVGLKRAVPAKLPDRLDAAAVAEQCTADSALKLNEYLAQHFPGTVPLERTSLEQIFNDFAAMQQEERGLFVEGRQVQLNGAPDARTGSVEMIASTVCKRVVEKAKAPEEFRRSVTLKSLLPGAEEAEEETEAFNTEVRRVLATQFNIAGSLVPWEEQAPEGGGSGFLDDDDDDEERPSVGHVAAAKNIVWARRFKVRIVDAPGVNDGVAAEAQACQDRAENRRIKARGLQGASDLSSETETSRATTDNHEAESSDDESDQYFRSANVSREETLKFPTAEVKMNGFEAGSHQKSSSSRDDS